MVKWNNNKEFPPQENEKKQFSAGEKGEIICPVCHSVYFKKGWHHNSSKIEVESAGLQEKSRLCPACQMIKNNQFEGQITISVSSDKFKADLIKLIENFCQRAFERNPLDRLIAIKKFGNGLTVTTTENQTAVKLSKKIREVFGPNRVAEKISYSPEPSKVAYVKINFVEE